ncbi:hypothetical protein NUSPORA_01748 [Nucleospora cyclopteri]
MDTNKELNKLIHDYLIANDFNNVAELLKKDAPMASTTWKADNDGMNRPLLEIWFKNFMEITAVRNSLNNYPASKNRIESILLSLESQKKRHQEIVDLWNSDLQQEEPSIENNMRLLYSENLGIRVNESVIYKELLVITGEEEILIYDLKSRTVLRKIVETSVKNLNVVPLPKSFHINQSSSGLDKTNIFSDSAIKRNEETVLLVYSHDSHVIKAIAFNYVDRQSHEVLVLNTKELIKSIQVISESIFVLNNSGYLNVFDMRGRLLSFNLFNKKLIYDIQKNIMNNQEILLLVDSSKNVIEYNIKSKSCLYLESKDIEPVITVKGSNLFICTNYIYVYKNSINNYSFSLKSEPGLIDYEIYKMSFVALTRDKIHFGNNMSINVTRANSLFVTTIENSENLIFLSDSGEIMRFCGDPITSSNN